MGDASPEDVQSILDSSANTASDTANAGADAFTGGALDSGIGGNSLTADNFTLSNDPGSAIPTDNFNPSTPNNPALNSLTSGGAIDSGIGGNLPAPGSPLQSVSSFGSKLWGSVSDPKFLGQQIIGNAVKTGLSAALSGNSPTTAGAMPASSSSGGSVGNLASSTATPTSSSPLGLNVSSSIPSINNTTGDLSGALSSNNNSSAPSFMGTQANVNGSPITPKTANANTQGLASPLANTSLYGDTFDDANSKLKPFVDPYSRAVPVT